MLGLYDKESSFYSHLKHYFKDQTEPKANKFVWVLNCKEHMLWQS